MEAKPNKGFKRKSPCVIFELDEADLSPDAQQSVCDEPENKIQKTNDTTWNSAIPQESNLDIPEENKSNISVEVPSHFDKSEQTILLHRNDDINSNNTHPANESEPESTKQQGVSNDSGSSSPVTGLANNKCDTVDALEQCDTVIINSDSLKLETASKLPANNDVELLQKKVIPLSEVTNIPSNTSNETQCVYNNESPPGTTAMTDGTKEKNVNDSSQPSRLLNISDSDGCEMDMNVSKIIQPDICIQFRNKAIAALYKQKFLKFIQSFVELEIENYESLTVNVNRDELLNPSDWVVLDNTICLSEIKESMQEVLGCDLPDVGEKSDKRKKKKKNKKEKDLFILDTNPSDEIDKFNLRTKYSSKFLINDEEKNSEDQAKKTTSNLTCFNCNGEHNLKDCPEPKDFNRINNNRQKFTSKTKSRYHLEDDQKYSHLLPGQISDSLREALGLNKHQLPPFTYHMRILGYPPGWLEEAKVTHSNLSMFDVDGNDVAGSKVKSRGLNIEKIIDYPGFNAPLGKGCKDEYKYHHTPPYSEDYCKNKMIQFYNEQFANAEDDLEPCDMDMDTTNEDFEETAMVLTKEDIKQKCVEHMKISDGNMTSPSLKDLEQEKETLLAALSNANENSNSSINIDKKQENDDKETSKSEDLECTDKLKETNSGEETENNENTQTLDSDLLCLSPISSRTRNSVKISTFGTPILKSSSPYAKLPNSENFSKDVSPVINFENLPNSTGKYEQMTGVLQRVRNTLKNLQKCNS